MAKNSSFLLPCLPYFFNDIQHHKKQFLNPQYVIFANRKLNKNAPLRVCVYISTRLHKVELFPMQTQVNVDILIYSIFYRPSKT